MRTFFSRLAVAVVVAGVATLGFTGSPASASVVTDCTTHLSDNQTGSLAITSTAAGGEVPAGSNVDLSATWDKSGNLEKAALLVCTTLDGVFAPGLSSVQHVPGNDGVFVVMMTLPGDLPADKNVCSRVILATDGVPPAGSQTSNEICFTSAAAVVASTTTTTTTTALVTTTSTTSTTSAPVSTAGTDSPVLITAPAVAPAATTPVPAPASRLPRTGAPVDVLAGLGTSSLILGGAARRVGRRRHGR